MKWIILGLLAVQASLAQASAISLQGSRLLQAETAGQPLVLLLTGSESFTDLLLHVTINGGGEPAPFVTHVFDDPAGVIPGANLASSVWYDGSGGIFPGENGTSTTGSGLLTRAAFMPLNGLERSAEGIVAKLTLSTVGVPPGDYTLSLAGSALSNGLDENLEPIPVPLALPNIVLRVVPEPTTGVLGSLGLIGLIAANARRRRRFKPIECSASPASVELTLY